MIGVLGFLTFFFDERAQKERKLRIGYLSVDLRFLGQFLDIMTCFPKHVSTSKGRSLLERLVQFPNGLSNLLVRFPRVPRTIVS